jgi:hypothetical protein
MNATVFAHPVFGYDTASSSKTLYVCILLEAENVCRETASSRWSMSHDGSELVAVATTLLNARLVSAAEGVW